MAIKNHSNKTSRRGADMLQLTDNLTTAIELDGLVLDIDLSYDNVLRFFELMESDDFSNTEKLSLSFYMLYDRNDIDAATMFEFVKAAHEYLKQTPYGNYTDELDDYEGVEGDYSDLEGEQVQTAIYDFKKDSAAIYASFKKEYGIDLIQEQGRLHWDVFKALFDNLSETAPINKIINIRSKSLQGLEGDELNATIELQNYYSLYSKDKQEEQGAEQISNVFSAFVMNAQNKNKWGVINGYEWR